PGRHGPDRGRRGAPRGGPPRALRGNWHRGGRPPARLRPRLRDGFRAPLRAGACLRGGGPPGGRGSDRPLGTPLVPLALSRGGGGRDAFRGSKAGGAAGPEAARPVARTPSTGV